MDDPQQLSKSLKDLPYRVQTASLKGRKEVIQTVIDVLTNPGVNDSIIKGLCRVIQLTLPRYRDRSSQQLVCNLITALIETHQSAAIHALIMMLVEIASYHKNLVVTTSTCQMGICALHWSCIVFTKGWKVDQKAVGKVLPQVVEIQGVLLTSVVAAGVEKRSCKAFSLLNNAWSAISNSEKFYLDALTSLQQSQYSVVLAAALARRLNQTDQLSILDSHLNCLTDAFIKSFVAVKKEPLANVIVACYPIMRMINVELFKSHLLPALQKAMLRSPETILETVGLVISGLTVDLKAHVLDLGQSFFTNLYSKDERVRNHAQVGCRRLAQQINDASAIEMLLKRLFEIYNGADGKISVVEHKLSLLQGAGNLSYNGVTGLPLVQLITNATNYFVKILKVEVHEKTLCFTLQMLAMWSSKFGNDVPNTFVDALKTGMELKSTTPVVRIAYIKCMLATFVTAPSLLLANRLVPLLLKSAEKATTAPVGSSALYLTEALCSACLLLRMATLNGELSTPAINGISQNSSWWNMLLDMDKQLFFNEKFLVQLVDDGSLIYVLQLVDKLLIDFEPQLRGDTQPLHRTVLYCCTYGTTPTRRQCLVILRRMVGGLGGLTLARALLQLMPSFLDIIKTRGLDTCKDDTSSVDSVSPHALIDCITTLCSNINELDELDAQLLALDAFLPAHHPIIVTTAPDLWTKIAKHLNIKPSTLLVQHATFFCKTLVDNYTTSPTNENALAAAVSINADVILPSLVNLVTERLQNSNIRGVSQDDYFTFLTPEGELYDKTVLPGESYSNDAHAMNMKRESKAYSYKEQLEEIQLRRELDEKRKRDGKCKPPTLTAKQLEAIKQQQIKEQQIRSRLSHLNTIIIDCVSMIRAAARGNPRHLALYFKQLLPALLQNLHSPLAAPYLSKLFADLQRIVSFGKQSLNGEVLGFIALRLLQPQCDLDANWVAEPLDKAVVRIVTLLRERCIDKGQLLEPAAFCYSFVLLRLAMQQHSQTDTRPESERLLFDGLQIINVHVKLTHNEDGNLLETSDNYLNVVKYFPIKDMLRLLITMISCCKGRVQTQAEACILDVAQAMNEIMSSENKLSSEALDEIDILLEALQDSVAVVREFSLRCLTIIANSLPSYETNCTYALRISLRVMIARFDETEENSSIAEKLWSLTGLSFDQSHCNELLDEITHPVSCVQLASAKALASILITDNVSKERVQTLLRSLLNLYRKHLEMIPAKMDEFGHVLEPETDIWQPRLGVALALNHLAPVLTAPLIGELVHFFVDIAFADGSDSVRKEMLTAALNIVDLHGKAYVNTLWPVFDKFMKRAGKSASMDRIKESVIVLMGSLARHLDTDDQRIQPIFKRLIQALSTPSQAVQLAAANCLPPLVKSVGNEASTYVNKLLNQATKGEKYAERKGAAYGLAGLVKGMGLTALSDNEILSRLTEAIQDKKNVKSREGALFTLEALSEMLGKLFEPYIIHVLPYMLQCLGDTSQYVRNAADETAKTLMRKLSAHGVKLIMPSLLNALEQDSWRTKTGSVEMLGAMAFCAPKQLSSCLPSIVPKLIKILNDSHLKVQQAACTALGMIGSVIRNPEIQAIVPALLDALKNPSDKTSICLQTLLDTKFVHVIDPPSLALIMPTVQRGFIDRSTETRKMAAQIIGNMYSLTNEKDLVPYLPGITPGLKNSLLDPVPEVRTVSARALGAMVKGMGESHFEDLLPWLMSMLVSESNSVDRSGAAQGLSEVIGGLGAEKLHHFIPEIIAAAQRTDVAPHVKDGYIMLFIYMPLVFHDEFTHYIGQIIPPILKALADENEFVRETALKAGQRIVTLYAESAILLLLPELESGLVDTNWRIRYSSVQLLGDLLYRVSGVSGKMSTETASEDDNFGTEHSHQAIIRALGPECRNRVLSGLYMGRSDVSLMVRQAALHVWKVVVTNTPRTLREILPTLFNLLLKCLASDNYDKRQVAGRTMGDLVRKLGERILPEIIPILEQGLDDASGPDHRQGVCMGLTEIMASTSKEMVTTFVQSLVPTVRRALCDPLPQVRQAAAKTFDSLHTTVGTRALDEILPAMLEQLNSDDPELVEWTLDGLRQVIAIKSRAVLPYLIPQLTTPPVNTKALAILASVAGESLNKHLPRILPALQSHLACVHGTPDAAKQLEYCQSVILSVTDEAGVRTVVDTLLENARHSEIPMSKKSTIPSSNGVASEAQRRATVTLLCAFCTHSQANYATHVPQLLRGLIFLLTDHDPDILQMSWEALAAVVRSLEPKQLITYVSDVRHAVRYAMQDLEDMRTKGAVLSTISSNGIIEENGNNSDRDESHIHKDEPLLLPGFCLPKGITPLMPVFREAMLGGDTDDKEAAALGLGEIIRVTSAAALQPSVVSITGPLIRVLGDRFTPNVKIAVLDTLAILMAKVGIMMKQFLPQLQTTFIKSLNDPNRTVRLKAASPLARLIAIHQRADPIFMELYNLIKNLSGESSSVTLSSSGLISGAGVGGLGGSSSTFSGISSATLSGDRSGITLGGSGIGASGLDPNSVRETTLHALRGMIISGGEKISDNVKKLIHQILLNTLLHWHDDVTRLCAAGCLGALLKHINANQLTQTMNEYLLVDPSQLEGPLRHGRCVALSIGLKESPECIWEPRYQAKIVDVILTQLAADKVNVTLTAVRSCGYLLQYLMQNLLPIPINLIAPFVRTMNHSSNEVKQLLARVCTHLGKTVPSENMSPELLKPLLPTLVNGTKEKNSFVKTNSEFAIIAILHLHESSKFVRERCLNILDIGARESLSDVINKILKKSIPLTVDNKKDALDETLLS